MWFSFNLKFYDSSPLGVTLMIPSGQKLALDAERKWKTMFDGLVIKFVALKFVGSTVDWRGNAGDYVCSNAVSFEWHEKLNEFPV